MRYEGERVEVGLHASCKVRAIPAYQGAAPALTFVDGSDDLIFVVSDSYVDLQTGRDLAIALARQALIFERYCRDRQLFMERSGWPEDDKDDCR